VASTEHKHQIGEVAERVGLSLRTVRYYEEQGLVVPEARTEGGFRLYTERQIERLLLVKKMKPLGFSLDEMRAMFDAREALASDAATPQERAAAKATIAGFAEDVQGRTAEMRRILEQSERFALELRDDGA
jgi:DNA-binding transcriptional MerR regulator